MNYFIADTHFNHANIIKYCHRPFVHVEEMQETIIRNWNHVVKPTDYVFHLGDFALKCTPEYKRWLWARLNGDKILVIGNHDIRRVGHWNKLGFECIKGTLNYKNWVLSHQPIPFPDRPNVHGHTHGNLHRGEAGHGIHVCVSVETTNYFPVSEEWVQKQIHEKGD